MTFGKLQRGSRTDTLTDLLSASSFHTLAIPETVLPPFFPVKSA